jgi:hypothetical protein
MTDRQQRNFRVAFHMDGSGVSHKVFKRVFKVSVYGSLASLLATLETGPVQVRSVGERRHRLRSGTSNPSDRLGTLDILASPGRSLAVVPPIDTDGTTQEEAVGLSSFDTSSTVASTLGFTPRQPHLMHGRTNPEPT